MPTPYYIVWQYYQWRIQLWADRAAAPIDQNLGLVVAARSSLPQTRSQVFILIVGRYLYENGQKS